MTARQQAAMGIGILLVLVGVALISWPVALIVAGIVFVFLAIFSEL